MKTYMVVTLGENTPSYNMVKKWDAEFKCGRDTLEDDPVGECLSPRRRYHCQDSWHHHDRQTSNGVLHCHWVGYLPGPHPCSHPQQTSYIHGVSTLCPKTRWTWFEMELAQHVKGKSCHFRSRSQQFASEICDCGWNLGPSLPTSDYYLFLKMKKELRGHHFARDECCGPLSEGPK